MTLDQSPPFLGLNFHTPRCESRRGPVTARGLAPCACRVSRSPSGWPQPATWTMSGVF